jgi:hypothetical protein
MSGLSEVDPIHFVDLLKSGQVLPGDHIILLDGNYAGDWVCEFAGTLANPIDIKPKNPSHVTIDGNLYAGAYIHWYDIDFTNSNTDRNILDEDWKGIEAYVPGFHLHGCSVLDLHGIGVSWYGNGEGEITECVMYNNGGIEESFDRTGYAIYSHNNLGGARLIARNILGDQIGKYMLHIYSSGDNWTKDYTIQDNISAGDDNLVGGGLGLVDLVYQHNIQFRDAYYVGRYSSGNVNGIVHGNYFVDLGVIFVDEAPAWALTETDNEIYGHTTLDRDGLPFVRAGYTEYDLPATKTWLIPYTDSARWLGAIAIYNRDSAATVSVDFSSLLANGNYRLRNGQNMTETWDFTQLGAAINVPMGIWSPSHVVGEGDGDTSLPVFGAFVIEYVDPTIGTINLSNTPT